MKSVIHSINELCIKITDGSHFSPENDSEGMYPMYSVKDMDYNGFLEYGYKTISEDIYVKLRKADCRPLKNDVLIAKDGSYLKYVFKCKENLDACILSSIAILRPNTNIIDPDYFVYLMRTQSVKMAMASYVSGSALPRIVLKDFKKMKLKMIEDTVEQNKIASVLVNYDLAIENNNKRIKTLEQIAENIYKEWFVRFRFPGHEDFVFENGIPKGWRKARIRNIAKECSVRETKENRDRYLHYVPIDCINSKSMALQAEDDIDNAESSLVSFKKGDILFGGMRPYFHKVVIAPYDGLTRTTCFVVNALNSEYKYFLYMLMFQNSSIDFATTISVGSTMPYVRWSDYERMNCIIPDINTVKSFNKLVGNIVTKIQNLSEQNSLLNKQRNMLLPRLMSGKLQVK